MNIFMNTAKFQYKPTTANTFLVLKTALGCGKHIRITCKASENIEREKNVTVLLHMS